MAICFLAGSLDEFYQYMILESTAFYYDFNDVLLDVIGAGIGLLILKIWGAKTTYSKTIWYKSYQWMIPITLSVTLIIMWLLGLFAVNNNFADPAWFTLFKRPPVEGFWFEPMGAHKRFHILTPIPGIVCIFIVCYIYGNLVKLSPKLETQ